tara:strand:+ start:2620 stop:3924 length:1305 start_codon:yes stop_codon:yes gene_type:complete
MTRAALKHIQHIALKTTFSTFLAALVILHFTPTQAADDVIDGYELPSMFEDDISTPIPDQSGTTQKQAPAPQTAPRAAAKRQPNTMDTELQYEETFKPIVNTASKKSKLPKAANVLLPIKRPNKVMPLRPPSIAAAAAAPKAPKIKNAVTEIVKSQATAPAPAMPRPETLIKQAAKTEAAPSNAPHKIEPTKSAPLPKQEIDELSQSLYERTDIAERPKARPAKIAARNKTNVKQNMPAVPPVVVAATPLAQPDFVKQSSAVKSISAPMATETPITNNKFSNISVALELENIDATANEALDVTNVIDGIDSNVATGAPVKNRAEAYFDTTQAHQATLFFAFGETDIADDMKQEIDTGILRTLENKADIRIEILSYAQAVDDTPSSARRVSLARALALRTYLLSKKIESHRIDVRALGKNTNKLPIDRIDVELIN